jgi:hypothetical protein
MASKHKSKAKPVLASKHKVMARAAHEIKLASDKLDKTAQELRIAGSLDLIDEVTR